LKPKGSFGRRNRIDILYQILLLCQEPQQKTWVMFKCNLSYELLQNYIGFLISNDFLRVLKTEDNKEYYQTTEKGKNLLREYKKIKSYFSES